MKNDKHFGVMLDMSRNAVMKPEKVKEFAKIIKSFGYNTLMLYMEDTFEVEGEPYFGYLRGKYTGKELTDLDSFCDSIGVELIPCVQTLAHLNQIFRWKEYQGINDLDDILLVDDERTYTLLDNIFKSLRKWFKTDAVNIGMDEAHLLGLGKYLDKHGVNNRVDIFIRHLNRVISIASKYGFKPVMWSDMFFKLAGYKDYYDKNAKIPDNIIAKIPKNVTLCYWDYYHSDKAIYDGMIKAHKDISSDVWFAGGAWSWTGFASGNKYTMLNMAPAMASCKENNIDNVIIAMWGDNGKECSFFSLLPSLFYIKQVYDGNNNLPDIKRRFFALTGEDFDALCALDLPNAVFDNFNPINNVSKIYFYSDLLLGIYDSTVSNGADSYFKKSFYKLNKYAKNSKFAYIFDVEAKLCDLLYYKYSLGANIRKAYLNDDMVMLKSCLLRIKTVIKKLDKFYSAFKNLWFTDNKPHGFDVQELRIGGLSLRLRSAFDRLNAYINGDISEIPELNDRLLDVFGNGNEHFKDLPSCNIWQDFSPNRI